MSRKILWLLIVLFVITRAPLGWLAARPDVYDPGGLVTANDVILYEGWSAQMIDEGNAAYREVPIEYPPGSLPFILVPQFVNADRAYLTVFVAMMLLIDIAALLGLILMAQRRGSPLGPILWILAVPALGPIAYLRLDLVPAVATIWAFERTSNNDWTGTGGWIGIGGIAKLYPLLFVPAGILLATERRRFLIATTLAFVAPLLPLLPAIGDVTTSVLGYHLDRGIQVESLWGGILFMAQRSGAEAGIEYTFGALHFAGPLSATLEPIATAASILGLIAGTAVAWRIKDRRDRRKGFPEACFVILALSLATGTVFSPQFLVWLLALGATVACIADSRLRWFALLLVPVAAMTQAIFPFLYGELLAAQTLPVALLWARNAAIAVMAIGGGIALWTGYRETVSGLSTPEPVSR